MVRSDDLRRKWSYYFLSHYVLWLAGKLVGLSQFFDVKRCCFLKLINQQVALFLVIFKVSETWAAFTSDFELQSICGGLNI